MNTKIIKSWPVLFHLYHHPLITTSVILKKIAYNTMSSVNMSACILKEKAFFFF